MIDIALVSTYEGGMQPLGLATAAAHLLSAGHHVKCCDSFIAAPSLEDLCHQDLVAFSIPLFESVEPAINLFSQTRQLRANLPIVFYGTYAMLNREALLAKGADGVILGDWEGVLVDVAAHISDGIGLDESITGLATCRGLAAPVYLRRGHMVPERSVLPALSNYSYSEAVKRIGSGVVVGNVETARGCRFSCSYCSVFAASKQTVTVFPESVVLADIAQVAKLGATHVCFADAEFLNAPAHALRIVSQMHEAFPDMTFDFTTRADLIAEDPGRIDQIVSCGGKFVTTAFEFPKQEVLNAINKQFTVKTLKRALEVCRTAGLGINPTFLLFNPWISFEDLESFSQFLLENNLENEVDPIQLQTRLWLYKGSPLLRSPEVQSKIESENQFNYEWRHSDPDVEQVFKIVTSDVPTSSIKRCCLKC
jgi:radical SAM superfamily enzyme YgiQ (UPF0313 family)